MRLQRFGVCGLFGDDEGVEDERCAPGHPHGVEVDLGDGVIAGDEVTDRDEDARERLPIDGRGPAVAGEDARGQVVDRGKCLGFGERCQAQNRLSAEFKLVAEARALLAEARQGLDEAA